MAGQMTEVPRLSDRNLSAQIHTVAPHSLSRSAPHLNIWSEGRLDGVGWIGPEWGVRGFARVHREVRRNGRGSKRRSPGYIGPFHRVSFDCAMSDRRMDLNVGYTKDVNACICI